MDSDPDQNGLVRYSLNDTTNFSIDEVTGEITTGMTGAPPNSSLYDFENIKLYYLEVNASGTYVFTFVHVCQLQLHMQCPHCL